MRFLDGESGKVGKNASVPDKDSITYSDALVVSYFRLVDVRLIKLGSSDDCPAKPLGLKLSK